MNIVFYPAAVSSPTEDMRNSDSYLWTRALPRSVVACRRKDEVARQMNRSRLLCGLATMGIFAMFSLSAVASPLSETQFDQLALSCAPGVELTTMRAVAAVESRFEPWAIRDNTAHQVWTPPTLASSIDLAEDRLRQGHSVDLGLMQINSGNLASLGLGVADAFDPCRSLDAARRILLNAFAAGSSETERQAAILITLSRYNTGRSLAGIANGYVNQVIMAGPAQQVAPNVAPQWEIWGNSGVEPTSWLVTVNIPSEIERAGAQTSDARNEGRAPASPSEKGEPYELSAYQESRPNRP